MVVDASLVVDALIEPGVELPEETLRAPHLIDVDVVQALRGLVRHGALPRPAAEAALGLYGDLPLHRYPHADLVGLVWALRGQLTAYDAVYVALAIALDEPFATRDRRLARAARWHVDVLVPG